MLPRSIFNTQPSFTRRGTRTLTRWCARVVCGCRPCVPSPDSGKSPCGVHTLWQGGGRALEPKREWGIGNTTHFATSLNILTPIFDRVIGLFVTRQAPNHTFMESRPLPCRDQEGWRSFRALANPRCIP